jgi:hypothetical protein
MALIWRGIFDVQSDAFVASARSYVESWLRWKLHDNTVELPGDGSLIEHASGSEITGRTASEGNLWGLRTALFEHRNGEQIRTTVTAVEDGDAAWVWVDLDRWSADAFVEPWVPIAPGVVGTVMRGAACSRGPSVLTHEAAVVCGDDGALIAHQILDRGRELPYVVVSPTQEERDGDLQPTIDRAAEVNRRLIGIAPVVVLGRGAVTAFSRTLLHELGEGFDVHSGAIRTYLPGIGRTDLPRHHRFVPFHRIRGRSAEVTADMVAAAIQRGACAQSPPATWREKLRPLLEPTGAPDDEIEAELLSLEQEREQERALRSRAEDTLEVEREMAAGTERENDDLRRRVIWLEQRVQELGARAEPTPPDDDPFDPDFCGDVPREVVARLFSLAFPEQQWGHADDLDSHVSASWARRAWRAFKAMDAYAREKAKDGFAGNLRDYCEIGGHDAVPVTWIALSESQSTDNNERFRLLRTLPLDPLVCGQERIYMPSHIKIEQGGYPSPRIHFHDDTGGTTGKVHIGYFGVHLDNKSKN